MHSPGVVACTLRSFYKTKHFSGLETRGIYAGSSRTDTTISVVQRNDVEKVLVSGTLFQDRLHNMGIS